LALAILAQVFPQKI